MENVIQQILNGISLGSIYALIALGYTMVYGILRLINFAHGDIYMMGAFLGYFAFGLWNFSFPMGLLFAMGGAAVLGIIIERFAYRPLRLAPRISLLITAIGVSFLLENLMVLWIGASPKPFPQKIPLQIYFIGDIVVTNRQIIIILVSITLMFLLQFIVLRTKVGKAMRAVSFDKETALMMGIDIDKVIALTFAIGSSLAAAAGMLVGLYFNKIDPYMGVMPGLKAFVAAVLGGIGIIPGAMLGGFILGIAEVLVSAFISSTVRDAVAFIILIFILLIRPSGILGKYMREKV